MSKDFDKNLIEALTRAYTARAKLFHQSIRSAKIDLLIAEIDGINAEELIWNTPSYGISKSAFQKVLDIGADPHQIFTHPHVLVHRPHLIAYYRNLATISKKGIGQMLFSVDKYESGRTKEMDIKHAEEMCTVFNRIISGVIDDSPDYSIELSRQSILAEIGTEIQGTWANIVGRGAAFAVEKILQHYIDDNDLCTQQEPGNYELKNGWKILFASEPDVAFLDGQGVKQIAIEIKGSLDKAGAQTRYGEAKKSFAKQITENPRCYTIYLASCFTESVIEQIQNDGQVRDWFNLTSILYDTNERDYFLRKLFHLVDIPTAPK